MNFGLPSIVVFSCDISSFTNVIFFKVFTQSVNSRTASVKSEDGLHVSPFVTNVCTCYMSFSRTYIHVYSVVEADEHPVQNSEK